MSVGGGMRPRASRRAHEETDFGLSGRAGTATGRRPGITDVIDPEGRLRSSVAPTRRRTDAWTWIWIWRQTMCLASRRSGRRRVLRARMEMSDQFESALARADRVVPIGMELVSLEVELFHLVIAAGRVMTHGDGEPGVVGESLQLPLPQAGPGAVAAAAIGGDQQVVRAAIYRASHLLPPTANGVHGEAGRCRDQCRH